MKVAWFGHKAKERGDSLITYSKEIIKGLEARGAEVISFYRSHKAEEDSENARWGPFNLFDQDPVSASGVKGIIDEVLERERVDVAHASLSFLSWTSASQISVMTKASLWWPPSIFLMIAARHLGKW